MISFSICLIVLIAGYFIYGRYIEKLFAIDPKRQTVAVIKCDGVDYVPLAPWRLFLIQFLNIAGLGPIFGAIMGAKFGASAYLWIVVGCIFAGSVHDYILGMLSLRYFGESYPEIIGRHLGNVFKWAIRIFTPLMLILVGTVFVSGPATLLEQLTQGIPFTSFKCWVFIIFVYYIAATLLPIDKLIGKVYPLFAAALVFMAVALLVILYVHMPAIPEVYDTLVNTHPKAETTPIFPMLFITIACGAISGFHATQSPMMARCMVNEKLGRPIFFGAMILEGIVALIWAAAANFAFHTPEGRALFFSGNASLVVNFISSHWLGQIGGVLAILGVIAAPITSGDTAFRSARLIVSDILNIEQKTLKKRFLVSLPLFVAGIALLFVDFNVIWRYFAWSNQVLATIALWAATMWFTRNKKNEYVVLIPTLFLTLVVSTYVFIAPEAFSLSPLVSYSAGALITLVCWLIYVVSKKRINQDTNGKK